MSLYNGFRMGVQSYSFREFSFDETLKYTQKLGLEFIEPYPDQLPVTNQVDQIDQALKKMKEHGITPLAFGVVGMGPDKNENREIFAFGQKLGVEVITANPSPDALDNLEELVEEFKINIAIHNHGPGSRWDKLDEILAALEGRHPRIGVCVDTGHFIRSKEEPVEAILKLNQRVHSVHMKDILKDESCCIFGKGLLDIPATLMAIQEVNPHAPVMVEYESEPENPFPAIKASLSVIQRTIL